MKKIAITLSMLCSMFFAGSALAACEEPVIPSIPKGITATTSEMQKAKEDVEAFLAEVEEYVNCGLTSTQAMRISNQTKLIVAKFNLELRAYQTRS